MSNAEAPSIRVVSKSLTESNAVAIKGSHCITATKFHLHIEPKGKGCALYQTTVHARKLRLMQ